MYIIQSGHIVFNVYNYTFDSIKNNCNNKKVFLKNNKIKGGLGMNVVEAKKSMNIKIPTEVLSISGKPIVNIRRLIEYLAEEEGGKTSKDAGGVWAIYEKRDKLYYEVIKEPFGFFDGKKRALLEKECLEKVKKNFSSSELKEERKDVVLSGIFIITCSGESKRLNRLVCIKVANFLAA